MWLDMFYVTVLSIRCTRCSKSKENGLKNVIFGDFILYVVATFWLSELDGHYVSTYMK